MIRSLDNEQQFRDKAALDGITHFVTRVAIFQDGKLLVLRRVPGDSYGGQYELPGGGVDEGETLHNSASRETLEETGLHIASIISEFEHLDYQTHNYSKVRQVNYKVTVLPGEVKLAPEEHDDYRWIEEADIADLETDQGTRTYLYNAFKD